MLSLTIHHNIHLTRDQRYALHEGIDIISVGFSVPIWFMNKMTSEPGKEVFCRYYLKNDKEDSPIQIIRDGYEITIPHRPGEPLKMSNDEWRRLNREDPEKLRAMYDGLVKEVSSKNLLDIQDGGGQCLVYREHNKVKKDDSMLSIMHFIQVNDMEHLTGSI